MAGIGFVLERVIDRRGIRGVLGASAAGVLIVAGPWLISTIALFVVGRIVLEGAARFFAVVVYSYVTTLLLFSGYHYRFTRILADALYIRDYATVRRTYRRTLAVAGCLGVLPAFAVGYLGGWRGASLVVPVLLYSAINTGWVHTLFASLLQKFSLVTWSYLAGASVTGGVALAVGLARISVDTAILLFALGMIVTGGIMAVTIRLTINHRLSALERLTVTRRGTPPTTVTLRRLATFGIGIAVILWLDNIFYWILLGTFSDGTMLLLYSRYDQTVFAAQLFVIPAMVIFMIRVETAYFRGLRGVLGALRQGTLVAFDRSRKDLVYRYNDALQGQVMIQFLMTIILVAAAPEVVRLLGLDAIALLVVTGIAAQIYFFFYTQMVNLLYLADYQAAITVILFTVVTEIVLTLGGLLLFGEASVGYAFLGASLVGSIAAWVVQRRALKDFDWLILTRINA